MAHLRFAAERTLQGRRRSPPRHTHHAKAPQFCGAGGSWCEIHQRCHRAAI